MLTFAYVAKSDDIFKGVKGPTNWQADLRENYAQKRDSKGVSTITTINNDLLKYWSGDNIGLFAFVNIPLYKTADNEITNSAGFGDLAFGAGPRGKISMGSYSTSFLSYLGMTIPTAKSDSKPALGNDRTDLKAGIYTTTLNVDKSLECDVSFEYTSAGKNSKGAKGLDEIAAGAILGARLTEDNLLRVGLGVTSKYKVNPINGWDHVYAPRAVIRITPTDMNWHVELIEDHDTATKNMPKGYSGTLVFRLNL